MTRNYCPRWTREMIDYLEEVVNRGVSKTTEIQAQFVDRFGVMPKPITIDRRLRLCGIRRHARHAQFRQQFVEFARQHPDVGLYVLCGKFNEQHGASLYGQLVRFWMMKEAAK